MKPAKIVSGPKNKNFAYSENHSNESELCHLRSAHHLRKVIKGQPHNTPFSSVSHSLEVVEQPCL